MRRALNVLQACKAALDSANDEIDEKMIYECVGAPDPEDIETILDSILQEDWTTSYLTFDRFKKTKGLALIDLVQAFVEILLGYELKSQTRIAILKELADIEYGVSRGGNEKIQTSAVIGVIKAAMENEA